MRSNNATPEVLEAIKVGLTNLEDKGRGYDSDNVLITAQRQLGWGALLFGVFHSKWREVQERFMKSIGLRLSSRNWISKLMRKI